MIFFKKKSKLRLHVTDDKYYVIHDGKITECKDLETALQKHTNKGEFNIIKGDLLDLSGYEF